MMTREAQIKRARMTECSFLFTSECMTEGHPDKICDQISDAILDACLEVDASSKVACETVIKDNMVLIAGEITTKAKPDYEKIAREVIARIGYDRYIDDLSSVESKGLDYQTCEVLLKVNKQSPNIASGVSDGKTALEIGAGDQGFMFGYASNETVECMPLSLIISVALCRKLEFLRRSGLLWWLRPDGKVQVTLQYLRKSDGSLVPELLNTIVISAQHSEPLRSSRQRECTGFHGPDERAPSFEDMQLQIKQHVLEAVLKEMILKDGSQAMSLFRDETRVHINPCGVFIIGGPQGDSGLTGRQVVMDTYGGWGSHGGGSFSGKDPSKVDRSGSYVCRQMAKSVVHAGLSSRCLVQLSYVIGISKPLALFVDSYGSEATYLTDSDITRILKLEFDCRPGSITALFSLSKPQFQQVASSCHFGSEPCIKDGIKFYQWECPRDLSKYRDMSSGQIRTLSQSSSYLDRWMD